MTTTTPLASRDLDAEADAFDLTPPVVFDSRGGADFAPFRRVLGDAIDDTDRVRDALEAALADIDRRTRTAEADTNDAPIGDQPVNDGRSLADLHEAAAEMMLNGIDEADYGYQTAHVAALHAIAHGLLSVRNQIADSLDDLAERIAEAVRS